MIDYLTYNDSHQSFPKILRSYQDISICRTICMFRIGERRIIVYSSNQQNSPSNVIQKALNTKIP